MDKGYEMDLRYQMKLGCEGYDPHTAVVLCGVASAGDDLCEYGDCQNQATHTESWYDEEGVDARVCDDHDGC